MGAFPADDLTVASLDAATDDPSQARAELLAAVNKVKTIIDSYNSASGICPLDANGDVPDANINATAMTALLNVVTTSLQGMMSAADKTKLNGIATSANNYTLPTASSTTLGGVKVGDNLSIASGVLSATSNIAAHTAGSYVIGNVTVILASTHAYTERMVWKISREGTIRVRIGYISPDGPGNIVYVRVLKNGVAQGSALTGTSTSWVYANIDIGVDTSDLIYIETNYTYYDGPATAAAVIMTSTPADTGYYYPYATNF